MAWVRVCTAEREDMQREREKGPTEHDILGRPAHLANGGSTNAMDPHVRLRSSLVSAPTCPSWNRRARARSAPARVARLLARTAGICGGGVRGALQGKTILQRATRDSSGALRAPFRPIFRAATRPRSSHGLHGAMLQNAFIPTRPRAAHPGHGL